MVAATRKEVQMSHFAKTILDGKYAHTKSSGRKEDWGEICHRVVTSVMKPYLPELVDKVEDLMYQRKFLPAGRYIYAAGRRYPQINNCVLLDVEDSRESWSELNRNVTSVLMTGAGTGVVYSKLREEGKPVGGLGGVSTGPLGLMQMVNEIGRHVQQGGSRRSAIWAGLHWNHPDCKKFVKMKNWPARIREAKAEDFNAWAPMDMTNISVILDDAFFTAYNNPFHEQHTLAKEIYSLVIRQMCKSAEPGFSIDIGANANEHLRNPCCEVSSSDNLDVCNLASINLSRINHIDEFEELIESVLAFQLCGTMYSVLPLPEMHKVREKNRRLGLGFMGLHEWLLKRGYKYEQNAELAKWMEVYSTALKKAHSWCDKLGISRSAKVASIAPTGTLAIICETTSGIEPIFAVAQKRRYMSHNYSNTWRYQYIIDATANRIIDQGVEPDLIEDAYDLAEDYERRFSMQAFVQQYVDHSISSTVNMPAWGSSVNNEASLDRFGKSLMTYLPKLRGITVYPDGARAGQPLNRVSYKEAVKHLGKEYTEVGDQVSVELQEFGNERACLNGVCGV